MACMDDEDGRYLAGLLRVLGQSAPWAERAGSPDGHLEPEPGSPMRTDDDRAHRAARPATS